MATELADWVAEHLDVKSWSGHEAVCRCVFHDDSDPSMWVNVDKEVFICFACGEQGRLDRIAEQVGVPAPGSTSTPRPRDVVLDQRWARKMKQRVQQLRIDDGRPDLGGLVMAPERELASFTPALDSWNRRGVWPWVQEQFELGYDPLAHALTIPLRTMGGHYVGACRRFLDPDAELRYQYPPGFSKTKLVYGAHQAKLHRRVVITEGSIDALRCWALDLPAVAVLGSDLSMEQYQILLRMDCDRYLIAGDGDEAGRKLNERVADIIGPRCRVIELPDGEDPGSVDASVLVGSFRQ